MKRINHICTKDGDILVDASLAAKRMGVCRSTIQNWQERGFLIPLHLGCVRLYNMAEVEKASRRPLKRKPRKSGIYLD